MLGPSLMQVNGMTAPEVERTYSRARILCEQLGNTRHLFWVLAGLAGYHSNRGDHRTGQDLATQGLRLAEQAQDPRRMLWAHMGLCQMMLYQGELVQARRHAERSLSFDDAQQRGHQAPLTPHDPMMYARWLGAQALYLLGYPDRALQWTQDALAVTQDGSHPAARVIALLGASSIHLFRGEGQAAQTHAEAGMRVCQEQRFTQWMAESTIQYGCTLALQGQAEAGIAQIRQDLVACQGIGAEARWTRHLALLAEAYGHTGQPEAGLRILNDALERVKTNAECWYEAEIYRLQGELLLTVAGGWRLAELTPEDCFQNALCIARNQQAKSWELRAATSLARLWQRQGKRQAAYDLLVPIYGWFTEGFDTADLQEANALLSALA
jgi:predicted ATPase